MIKVDESKSAERMLKTLLSKNMLKILIQVIKVDEKQERRTHAKKSLSKYDKSG